MSCLANECVKIWEKQRMTFFEQGENDEGFRYRCMIRIVGKSLVSFDPRHLLFIFISPVPFLLLFSFLLQSVPFMIMIKCDLSCSSLFFPSFYIFSLFFFYWVRDLSWVKEDWKNVKNIWTKNTNLSAKRKRSHNNKGENERGLRQAQTSIVKRQRLQKLFAPSAGGDPRPC